MINNRQSNQGDVHCSLAHFADVNRLAPEYPG